MDIANLRHTFRSIYKTEPLIVRSPGRINILGEHTDYNEGLVMPAAIDKAIYVAVSKRSDDEIHLFAVDYSDAHVVRLSDIKISPKSWPNYILGVVDQLQKKGYQIGGFNFYIDGDVPLGAGLSSSAAVACATAYALDQLFGLLVPKLEMVLTAQKAEQAFAGVNCGIMDQFASVFGKKNHAMLLDCRSMEYQYLPLNLEGYKLVLFNTNVKHALAESAYNTRRMQCEQGVAWIREAMPFVQSLRDCDINMLDQFVKPKNAQVYLKCRYVIEENVRLTKAAGYLRQKNLDALGQLMFETHDQLSRAYEVSCTELDFLVNLVRGMPEVPGARMMGGGFGGCTLNIIKEGAIARLVREVSDAYHLEFGIDLKAYIVETAHGTSAVLQKHMEYQP